MPPDWKKRLDNKNTARTWLKTSSFIELEYGKEEIFPERKNLFKALDLCSFDSTKVIIIGQDPYHGAGQANGLAFSVNDGVKIPPSLRNIYKELESDLGITVVKTGDLSSWAKQGVLLLNSVLTVRRGEASSHRNQGWEEFTDSIINNLSENKTNLVFILWGNYARNKGSLIDPDKHLVIESSHPSPLSAYNGFFGSRPFSRTNQYLKKNNISEINWSLGG